MQGSTNTPSNPPQAAMIPVPPAGKVYMTGVEVIAAWERDFIGDKGKKVEYGRAEIRIPTEDDPERAYSVKEIPCDVAAVAELKQAMKAGRPVMLWGELVERSVGKDRNGAPKHMLAFKAKGIYHPNAPRTS